MNGGALRKDFWNLPEWLRARLKPGIWYGIEWSSAKPRTFWVNGKKVTP